MKCKICGNNKCNVKYEVFEMFLGYRDKFKYFECSICDCLQIINIPDNIERYYPPKYYSFEPPISRERYLKRFFRNLRTNFAVFNRGIVGKYLYLRKPSNNLRILHNLKITKKTKILDVGCGRGVLLYSLNVLGFKNILGIDPYIVKDFKNQYGLEILKKTIHDINDKWDIILFMDSFEHLSDPQESLQSVKKCLNHDGQCIIRMPIFPSYVFKKYGVNWVQLDAPRHFFIHSLKSMEIMTRNAGLSIEKIEYASDAFQFWGSELYLKGIPLVEYLFKYNTNKKQSIFSKKDMNMFIKDSLELNKVEQGDAAIFYLKNVC